MQKKTISYYLTNFGLHLLTILAGLILLLNPDGAVALVTKLIGWVLVIGCAARLISLAVGNQLHWRMSTFFTGAALGLGVLLLAKPLILANLMGTVFGILLLIEGLGNLRAGGLSLATALTIVAGLVLIIIPRSLTQTLLAVFGIVLIFIGIVNLLDQFRATKRLNNGSNAKIIDADV